MDGVTSEAVVQQRVQDAFCAIGGIPWRNNSGAFTDERGILVRYGLANLSKKMNEEIKSSDIIGILPIHAYTQRGSWQTIGIFTAIECKSSDWHLTPGDKRGQAQKRFIDLVTQHGGYAGFATCVEDLYRIIGYGKE